MNGNLPPQVHAGEHTVMISREPDTQTDAPAQERIANPDVTLRSRIVEILASTSNGCLTELGYHPRISQKLHQHIQRIQTLEIENAKLYQDNCQLSVVVQQLTERLVYLSANQSTQLQQFTAMQERLRTLETERNNLVRNNQDILISTNAGTSHHLLGMELQRMRAQTSRVRRDMDILQTKYMRLSTSQRVPTSPGSGVSSPSNSVPQIAQPTIPPDRRVSVDGAPRTQPSRLPQQQLQQQTQQHVRQMQQQVQHTQQLQQVLAQRRISDGVANPYSHQIPPHVAVGWVVPSPASAPPVLGGTSPTGPAFISPPPISAPANANRPCQPPHTLPLMDVSRTAHHTVSAPVMSKLHTTPMPLPSPCKGLTRDEPDESAVEKLARSGEIDQPSNTKRPSSTVDGTLAQDNEAIKRQRTAQPTHTPQDSIVNEKLVPLEPEPTSDAAPAGSAGVSNDEVVIVVTPSDTIVNSDPTSPISVEPSPPTPLTQFFLTGPPSGDGLRPVEDCVYTIYEPDAEITNGYFCGRCLDRFESGMLPEPPDVLVNPKFEDLFIHCTKEHPTIWEDLRYKKDLQSLPS